MAPVDPVQGFARMGLHSIDPKASSVDSAQSRAAQAALRLSRRSFQGALLAQARLMGFAARRLQRDFDTARQLKDCQTTAEALAVLQAHGVDAMADYAEETTALIRIGAEAIAGQREPGD